MQGTAIAQPNIALIKYWGKRDIDRNLPAVGSISITLRELHTRMHVELDEVLDADVLTVNDEPDENMLPRLSACLDRVGLALASPVPATFPSPRVLHLPHPHSRP